MAPEPRDIALAYIVACGRKDLDTVASLLSPHIQFVGPSNTSTGAAPYLESLRQLGPIWVRSDVRRAFSDGSTVCVLYDFVTNTAAGAVPIVELLTVEDGKIASVTLIFDRVAFKPASDELARRAGR
jgi:hypothetical protein